MLGMSPVELTRGQVTPTSAHGTKGGTDRVRPDKVAKATVATPAPAGASGPRPPKAGAWGDDLSYQQWDMHSIFVPRTHAHNIKGKGVKVRASGVAGCYGPQRWADVCALLTTLVVVPGTR